MELISKIEVKMNQNNNRIHYTHRVSEKAKTEEYTAISNNKSGRLIRKSMYTLLIS